ncbi:hypothetical protein LCGC14_0380830 [marine sediment metagenome]|uniref:Uncharacterized protein n=1 Tax=marine sediment metagenome TaxID=412755 RepID=A0A0F9TKP6_9ZZZZ
MKVCPCCYREVLHEEGVRNSISHIDNKTEICSKCGLLESTVGMGVSTNAVDIAMYERFKGRFKK